MAANKFATMLHKNSPKLTVILVYALLEWILIILLLLNSLFFYIITKFANYFGLKPPCLWCSRLLDPSNTAAYPNLFCDTHASEISRLGFCSVHRKLALTQNMCTDCLASCPSHNRDSIAVATRVAFISLDSVTDNDAITVKCCSCCSQSFSDELYSPYDLLLKHSWKALKYSDGDFGKKTVAKSDCLGNETEGEEHQMLSDFGSFGLKDSMEEEGSGSESNLICFKKEDEDHDDRKLAEDHCVIDNDFYELNCVRDSVQSFAGEDFSLEFIDLHFDIDFERQTDRLIPVELLDSSIFGNRESFVSNKQDPDKEDEAPDSPLKLEKQSSNAEADIDESSVFKEQDDLQAEEEETNDIELSSDQAQEQESTNGVEIANSPEANVVDNKIDTNEKIFVEEETRNQLSSIHSESNEADDEKFPETPTSIDSYNYLHKKRESGTEGSIDGSISSEIEAGDLTVEKLSTALKSERKALNALYAELEEERSASAISASQTMAMINRLQEEKAAMQMEALQYQRMMEEQSEYDQEALQLLNELMLKREREKLELERELEVYRKKVTEYEAKERARSMIRASSEDLDELSIDLNCEPRDDDDVAGDDEVVDLEEIALDCVKQIGALDDSLAEFEEERLSILDQLKALEEKLVTLHNNELDRDDEESGEFDGSYEAREKTMGDMAKSLLPLLDAAENENENEKELGLTVEENGASEVVGAEFNKKVALEDEVDHVYERLHALEADREFLKHCMSSIKKGDKGMDLLREILQHLRDLRAVEVRVRNMNDDPLE